MIYPKHRGVPDGYGSGYSSQSLAILIENTRENMKFAPDFLESSLKSRNFGAIRDSPYTRSSNYTKDLYIDSYDCAFSIEES